MFFHITKIVKYGKIKQRHDLNIYLLHLTKVIFLYLQKKENMILHFSGVLQNSEKKNSF